MARSEAVIRFKRERLVAVSVVIMTLLAACGGGGSAAPATHPAGAGDSSGTFSPGVYQPASTYAALCASPRTGVNPSTGQPWPDIPGTTADEKNWLRSWTHNTYLWYREIQDVDPAGNDTTLAYFNLMKTFQTTASGAPRDKFHFTIPTDQWQSRSQSGVTAGYGATFTVISSTPPRTIVVAYTQPNSPATSPSVNLVRGDTVLAVDGVDAVNSAAVTQVDALNAGLFPTSIGESHTFSIKEPVSTNVRDVTMVSQAVTEQPVQDVRAIDMGDEPVGYMVFNDHIATAEKALVNAVDQLKADGIVDLVLDLRYNGGGYLDIASELAYMIAGPVSQGRTFELEQFNDKYPDVNPITGAPIKPTLFHNTSVGLSVPSGQDLPSLDLSRVYVLTGPDTCSASESIINSLRGIGIKVYQIGSTTCGKPYGFYPADNCGTTYFSIQFRGINAAGDGDYTNGFSPDNVANPTGVPLPGCQVADDFSHKLGDVNEGRLAAALQYRSTGSCSVAAAPQSARALTSARRAPLSAVDGHTPKPVWLQNRIMSQ